MNIDIIGMQKIIDTTGIGRPHLYTGIHKALRKYMSAVLTSVGQLDADDDLQCREVMADVQQLLDVLRGHVETENTMVHPAIEARYPGALAGITAEHAGHEVAIEQLRHYARTLLTISGKERGAFALFLYRELSSFVAENLEHMLREETQNQHLLWAAYSDAELQAIEEAILASLPPEKMAVLLPWIVSAISVEERLEMYQGMRQAAPALVFDNALSVARSCLPAHAWEKLSTALDVAN
ncbi:MAG: hemerythrin domain-containing protein [Propionivibrio sp.]|nr:hemerythrin domain-containing protein [Propionivibrio sp.]